MSRSQAESLLWDEVVAAFDAGHFHRAKEFEAHLSEIENMTDEQFMVFSTAETVTA